MSGETQSTLREFVALNAREPFVPDMRVGIAMMQDSLDLPERVDEATLATALREVVPEADGYVGSFLAMLADALDNPDAEYRLRIVRNRRGRPNTRDSEQAMGPAFFIEWRVREAGVPFKAAVMDAMEQFNCSRATVFRSLKRWRKLTELDAILGAAATNRRGADD